MKAGFIREDQMAEERMSSAETALNAILDVVSVRQPKSGPMRGRTILVFQMNRRDPESYYTLAVAHNSYDHAALNAIGGAIAQGRRVLGMPQLD